jgi:hypothetical protein
LDGTRKEKSLGQDEQDGQDKKKDEGVFKAG